MIRNQKENTKLDLKLKERRKASHSIFNGINSKDLEK
jgi:hypothetical protein